MFAGPEWVTMVYLNRNVPGSPFSPPSHSPVGCELKSRPYGPGIDSDADTFTPKGRPVYKRTNSLGGHISLLHPPSHKMTGDLTLLFVSSYAGRGFDRKLS